MFIPPDGSLRSDHFSAPASRPATFAPPDFDTNDVRMGMALATRSGLSPSFENADAAAASPPAAPAMFDSELRPLVPTAPPAGGAALSSMFIPGTAFATCEKSFVLRRDFATKKKKTHQATPPPPSLFFLASLL